jgi:hypothetical protein
VLNTTFSYIPKINTSILVQIIHRCPSLSHVTMNIIILITKLYNYESYKLVLEKHDKYSSNHPNFVKCVGDSMPLYNSIFLCYKLLDWSIWKNWFRNGKNWIFLWTFENIELLFYEDGCGWHLTWRFRFILKSTSLVPSYLSVVSVCIK